MTDNQPIVNAEKLEISMDSTGIIIHMMIAGVMVGFTLLSWTQLKVNTPSQREAALKSTKSAVKATANVTLDILRSVVAAAITKEGKGK